MAVPVEFEIHNLAYGNKVGAFCRIGEHPDCLRFALGPAVDKPEAEEELAEVVDGFRRLMMQRVELVRVLGVALEEDRLASLNASLTGS